MRRQRAAGAVVVAALAVGGAGGCGGSSGGGGATATTPPERADRRPALPRGWRRVVNLRAGFSVGIPPGWTARGGRGATLVRSADRGLAVSIAADRGTQGQSLPPDRYARRTLEALPGYRGLRIGPTRPVREAHYPAAAVTATGTYRPTRVRQAISAIALHRPGIATFTLLVFRNARVPAAVYARAVDEMVRSFRSQPPQL
jgi:hypothetical protein